jgi:hypothetical protein
MYQHAILYKSIKVNSNILKDGGLKKFGLEKPIPILDSEVVPFDCSLDETELLYLLPEHSFEKIGASSLTLPLTGIRHLIEQSHIRKFPDLPLFDENSSSTTSNPPLVYPMFVLFQHIYLFQKNKKDMDLFPSFTFLLNKEKEEFSPRENTFTYYGYKPFLLKKPKLHYREYNTFIKNLNDDNYQTLVAVGKETDTPFVFHGGPGLTNVEDNIITILPSQYGPVGGKYIDDFSSVSNSVINVPYAINSRYDTPPHLPNNIIKANNTHIPDTLYKPTFNNQTFYQKNNITISMVPYEPSFESHSFLPNIINYSTLATATTGISGTTELYSPPTMLLNHYINNKLEFGKCHIYDYSDKTTEAISTASILKFEYIDLDSNRTTFNEIKEEYHSVSDYRYMHPNGGIDKKGNSLYQYEYVNVHDFSPN